MKPNNTRPTATDDGGKPYVIALLAMGPSITEYHNQVLNAASRRSVADEVWTINAATPCFIHDRAIIMDDLRYFAKEGRNHKHLQGYADWLHDPNQPPIYTSRAYEEFPASRNYPLEDVLNDLGHPYFNTTAAFAIGLAIHEKPREIRLYGFDFTYKNDRGHAEAGRACCEFWIAEAATRGVVVRIADSSTLCDRHLGGQSLYGYSKPPKLVRTPEGKYKMQSPESAPAKRAEPLPQPTEVVAPYGSHRLISWFRRSLTN